MDWNRFLDKNISQDENYDDVIDDNHDEALVTSGFLKPVLNKFFLVFVIQIKAEEKEICLFIRFERSEKVID
jgi:hypothetical protein